MKIEISNRKDYESKIHKEKNNIGYFSEQRPQGYGETFGFYEKINFELIAQIKDWTRNHTRYEFIKYVRE